MRNANERPQKAVQGNNKNLLYYIDPWIILHTRPCDIIQGHSRPNRQQKFTRAIKGHKRSWKAIEGHKTCYKITKVHNHAQNLMSSRLTNFWQPTVHVQQNILKKFLVYIFTFLLAPFAPKLVIYSRHSEWVFESRHSEWVFELLKIDKLLLSKENVVDFGILQNVWRLTVSRIIDQFGRKRCQKKRKRFGLQTSIRIFSKIFSLR